MRQTAAKKRGRFVPLGSGQISFPSDSDFAIGMSHHNHRQLASTHVCVGCKVKL